MNTLTRTNQTVLLAVVSGIASGLLFTVEPLWLAGVVFGLLFGLINLDKKLLAIPYAIASSVIYRIAISITVGVGNVSSASDASSSSELSLVFGFLLAGAFGAIALALVTQVLKKMPTDMGGLTRTTLIGAVAGAVFYLLIRFMGDGGAASIAIYLAYTIWQVAVAWSLTASIQKRSTAA